MTMAGSDRRHGNDEDASKGDDRRDAAQALRFMAIKIAVFGILPIVVAVLIVLWRLG